MQINNAGFSLGWTVDVEAGKIFKAPYSEGQKNFYDTPAQARVGYPESIRDQAREALIELRAIYNFATERGALQFDRLLVDMERGTIRPELADIYLPLLQKHSVRDFNALTAKITQAVAMTEKTDIEIYNGRMPEMVQFNPNAYVPLMFSPGTKIVAVGEDLGEMRHIDLANYAPNQKTPLEEAEIKTFEVLSFKLSPRDLRHYVVSYEIADEAGEVKTVVSDGGEFNWDGQVLDIDNVRGYFPGSALRQGVSGYVEKLNLAKAQMDLLFGAGSTRAQEIDQKIASLTNLVTIPATHDIDWSDTDDDEFGAEDGEFEEEDDLLAEEELGDHTEVPEGGDERHDLDPPMGPGFGY